MKTLSLVAFVAAGIASRIEAGSKFYKTAMAYHGKNKTVFPRPRNDAMRAALTMADVEAVFKLHDGGIGDKARLNGSLCTLPAGDKRGQAMFDVFKMTPAKKTPASVQKAPKIDAKQKASVTPKPASVKPAKSVKKATVTV